MQSFMAEKAFTSYLAAWHQGAVRVAVAPPPLKRLAELDLDEAQVTSFALVDKVVVLPDIPKQFMTATQETVLIPVPTFPKT